MSGDPKKLAEVTPSMFLIERVNHGLPDCDAIDRSALCRNVRHLQKLREDLRHRFRNQYLGQLKLFSGKSHRVKLNWAILYL